MPDVLNSGVGTGLGGLGLGGTPALSISEIVAGFVGLTDEQKATCFSQVYTEFQSNIEANKTFVETEIIVNVRSDPEKYNLLFK